MQIPTRCPPDPAISAQFWTYVDALFFCMVLVSTVGYGANLVPGSPKTRASVGSEPGGISSQWDLKTVGSESSGL